MGFAFAVTLIFDAEFHINSQIFFRNMSSFLYT